MFYAHYTNGSKTRAAMLRITQDIEARVELAAYPVKGKREARRLATSANAKPWNF